MAKPTEAEREREIDALASAEAPQVIGPRVVKALFEGLEAGTFGYGYFKEERPYYERNSEEAVLSEGWKELIHSRLMALNSVERNSKPYRDGLRVGRILMDLQAKETVGELTVTRADLDAYINEIRREYSGLVDKFQTDGQQWYRDGFSENRLALYDPQLGQVATEYVRYRWPEDRWQIRMGMFDAYMIGQMKINTAMDAQAQAPVPTA